jgi:hypothetical protein
VNGSQDVLFGYTNQREFGLNELGRNRIFAKFTGPGGQATNASSAKLLSYDTTISHVKRYLLHDFKAVSADKVATLC